MPHSCGLVLHLSKKLSKLQPISGRINGIHTFPKGICPKVNVIARLEFELAYYDFAVHRFNHYTTRTPLENLGNSLYWYTRIYLHTYSIRRTFDQKLLLRFTICLCFCQTQRARMIIIRKILHTVYNVSKTCLKRLKGFAVNKISGQYSKAVPRFLDFYPEPNYLQKRIWPKTVCIPSYEVAARDINARSVTR